MRIGQTSFVVFVSKLLASVLGFLATLYFARLLGAEVLGYYAVIIAVVSWLKLGGTLGISQAVVKRISEDTDSSAYFTAGALTVLILALIFSVGVIVFRGFFDSYVGVESWHFIIALLLTGLLTSFAQATLKGERKVHIAGILSPVNLIISSIIQIGLVFAGFRLTGMLIGYIVGEVIVGFLSLLFISVELKRPKRQHFRKLFDFAKYSWLGGLKTRSFSDVDILLLGALVSSSLVGVYSVAWSLSQFLTLFGRAVRSTLFPEISNADVSNNAGRVKELTEESLAFIGLIAIPGLFGGFLIAERLLRIYGDEFVQGTAVLGLLILSTLIFSYQQQMVGIIKGVDRPDIAFRINLIFILTNVVLNVILILWIGWVGAAVATVLSAVVGLVLAYRELRELVDFSLPLDEIGRQFGAALFMGIVITGSRQIIEDAELLQHNALLVSIFVLIGAGTYFLTLLGISRRFRETVAANTPIPTPFIS